MEDLKKRKMDEASINGSAKTSTTQDYLRSLLDPLNKPQLVDLLSRLGSQYPSIAEEIKSLASADPVHRKLFVRGLAWNTTSETLCAEFRIHGEIEEGSVIYDKVTGKSRGYGFITYKHMESAQRALGAPSKLIDGRMAVCNLACEGLTGATTTPDLTQRKLYIGGLSPEISSEMLLHFFGRYGEIGEGSVAYNKDTNESRGFGFITYKTVEAAKKAIDDPHKLLGGRTITVKLADTHKGKTVQMQSPAPMVPVPVPMAAAGYAQPCKAPVGSGTPVGYPYPQTVASYPASSYPNPPVAPAPYPTQSQVSYAPVSAKKELLGLSSTPPVGMGGYPNYYPKQ
ncbi:PREDICTED: UBP1-associated protein 2A-like [Populus euphratica]|uniref:UBP1-associated protein 2A-like n=1 Tax=Populus euphratica TaxID=75702 RepID=A0AAJ6T561_POPEU|nr:PREDICTED: UBP1-associated protein 2A-like [Populus euphratica]